MVGSKWMKESRWTRSSNAQTITLPKDFLIQCSDLPKGSKFDVKNPQSYVSRSAKDLVNTTIAGIAENVLSNKPLDTIEHAEWLLRYYCHMNEIPNAATNAGINIHLRPIFGNGDDYNRNYWANNAKPDCTYHAFYNLECWVDCESKEVFQEIDPQLAKIKMAGWRSKIRDAKIAWAIAEGDKKKKIIQLALENIFHPQGDALPESAFWAYSEYLLKEKAGELS